VHQSLARARACGFFVVVVVFLKRERRKKINKKAPKIKNQGTSRSKREGFTDRKLNARKNKAQRKHATRKPARSTTNRERETRSLFSIPARL